MNRVLLWTLGFWEDVRFSMRQFRRAPGYAMFTILVLAPGIGDRNCDVHHQLCGSAEATSFSRGVGGASGDDDLIRHLQTRMCRQAKTNGAHAFGQTVLGSPFLTV